MQQDEPAAELCVEQAQMQGVSQLLHDATDKVNFIYEDGLRWTCLNYYRRPPPYTSHHNHDTEATSKSLVSEKLHALGKTGPNYIQKH